MSDAAARRAVILGPGEIVLEEFDPPVPGVGELLIRVDAIGICGTDLELFDGTMPYLQSGFATYPIVPGHEWTGTVIGLGGECRGFVEGDRVVGECTVGCGRCLACLTGSPNICPDRTETGIARRAGGFATHLVFPARAAHIIPPAVSTLDAAMIEPLAVACRGIKRAQLHTDASLCVIGAGAIGLLSAMIAAAHGIRTVRVIDTVPARRTFAESLGFACPQASETFDRVVEASGSLGGVARALELAEPGGIVVLLGLIGGLHSGFDVDRVVLRDLQVRGSVGSPGVWPDTIEMLARGELRPSRLISHELPLDRAAAAFDLASRQDAHTRKVIVRPNEAFRAVRLPDHGSTSRHSTP